MTPASAPAPLDVSSADAAVALSRESGHSGELAKHKLELRLFPVFDLRKRLASTLFCVPIRMETGGGLKLGHWLVESLAEPDAAAVDLELLKIAIDYAKRFEGSSATAAVGTSVSFATLINVRHRKDYVAALNAVTLPPTNPLVIQIESLPSGTPMARIADTINQVGQSANHVLMTIPASATGDLMWKMGALGATGIGINLMGREDDGTVARMARSLMGLCRSQSALGYMNMLTTAAAVDAAAAYGVRFGTGPALSLTTFLRDGPLPRIPVTARKP